MIMGLMSFLYARVTTLASVKQAVHEPFSFQNKEAWAGQKKTYKRAEELYLALLWYSCASVVSLVYWNVTVDGQQKSNSKTVSCPAGKVRW